MNIDGILCKSIQPYKLIKTTTLLNQIDAFDHYALLSKICFEKEKTQIEIHQKNPILVKELNTDPIEAAFVSDEYRKVFRGTYGGIYYHTPSLNKVYIKTSKIELVEIEKIVKWSFQEKRPPSLLETQSSIKIPIAVPEDPISKNEKIKHIGNKISNEMIKKNTVQEKLFECVKVANESKNSYEFRVNNFFKTSVYTGELKEEFIFLHHHTTNNI